MMCSWPAISTVPPPASSFEARTASATSVIETPYARSRSGSTWIWYYLTKPPTEATSATPGTLSSA